MTTASEKAQDLQALWSDRIRRAAKKRKEDFDDRFQVKKGREYFEGAQKSTEKPLQDQYVINKIFSHLMAELPSLYAVDPFFYVKLKRSFKPNPMAIAMMEMKAKVRQSYLNYLKGELKLKTTARLCIMDAYFEFGVVKTHYSADMVDNPDKGKPLTLEGTEIPLLGDDNKILYNPDQIPTNEKYNWSRVHPSDILFDEDAGPLPESWRWIAQRIRMDKDEALADKDIRNAVLAEGATKDVDKDQEREGGGFKAMFNIANRKRGRKKKKEVKSDRL